MNPSANRTATPAGFHRNARLVCFGTGGWLRSESVAGFVGIRILAAIETTPEGKPVRLKLRRVTSFCRRAVEGFAKRSLDRTCEVVSDGLGCFAAVAKAGCQHTVITTGSGARAARTPAFKWVNTALGNMKAAITGTYRSIAPKHVPRYLAEFEYRFNRRYDLAAMLRRLATAALQAPPMPYRLLKLAEVPA